MSAIEAFHKIVNPGTVDVGWPERRLVNLFCNIKWDGQNLSITGVEGPRQNGDCAGSCGQCIDSVLNLNKVKEGWDQGKVELFHTYWDVWHLNDLEVGSPAQRAYLAKFPKDTWRKTHEGHYDWACCVLKEAGLQPDPHLIYSGVPYSYGSKWLRTEVPYYVLDFLRNLPETEIEPAWV